MREQRNLFARLQEIGFQCCLLSNNKEGRVKMFNEEIGVNYIYDAHKPSTKNYKKAMEIMGTDLHNTIFIGDQLFTDVYGAMCRNKKYFGETNSPKGRTTDYFEAIFRENRAIFLQERT